MQSDLVYLNVGGQKFCTSRQTLLSVPGETFFTSLLSERISSTKDSDGAYFIDRDPNLFHLILNYLRTKQLSLLHEASKGNLNALIHESQFYGFSSLAKQLKMCEDVEKKSACGSKLFCGKIDPPKEAFKVKIVKVHNSTIVAAGDKLFSCYQYRGVRGFQKFCSSGPFEPEIQDIALRVKIIDSHCSNAGTTNLVAVAHGCKASIVGFTEDGVEVSYGTFELPSKVTNVFHVGLDMIALSYCHIGVWRSKQWQAQRVEPIMSFDVGGSFLLLGSDTGSICYVDMEKFPLRMKDNDLLVTEMYRDPSVPFTAITAMSVYIPTKTKNSGNWIEIAYGTATGLIRVIVQYP